jgi:DNA processing protein
MEMNEKLACIRLIRTRNIGPMTYHLLIKRYGSAREALRAIPELARRSGRRLEPVGLSMAEAEMAANQAVNATLLFRGGDGYPERLDQFDDAPAILSVKGNQHLLSRPNIAMVGARNASLNALRHAEKLGLANSPRRAMSSPPVWHVALTQPRIMVRLQEAPSR